MKDNKRVCPIWMVHTFDIPLRKLFTPDEKVLKPYLKEGMTFLDLGCGSGRFSIRGAKLVAKSGKVIALDIQQGMLDIVEKKIKDEGLENIIKLHLAEQENLNLNIQADFALAMWMVHETPDFEDFFKQVKDNLKHGAKFLVVEPTHHVSIKTIEKEVTAAQKVGFNFCGYEKIGLLSKGFILKN